MLDAEPLPEPRAVITADIVRSTKSLDPKQRAQLSSRLRRAYREIQKQHKEALPYPLAIARGDSWQCYVHDPAVALDVALYMRARTLADLEVDTRFALASAWVDFVDEENVGDSDGEAFRASGDLLDSMEGGRTIDIMVFYPDQVPLRTIEVALAEAAMSLGSVVYVLADRIAQSWTPSQAEAVAWKILHRDWTNEEIGKRWKPEAVSHQSVSKHLKRAGWEDLRGAIAGYRSAIRAQAQLLEWLDATVS